MDEDEVPWTGSVPYSIGQPSMIRIPIPGSDRLAIEFRPRGHVPASGSTSTLFLQDPSGRRHLRLDYGYNKNTGAFDYHWNQKGVHSTFGINNHQPAGRTGAALYNGAKYFRHAGRVLVVVGVVVDVASIVQASNPLRRTAEVAGGWAGAWGGCKVGGGLGAAGGSIVAPGPGTAIGGIGGCIVGGFAGYFAGEAAAGWLYDWAEDTFFTPLPEVSGPD